MGRVRTFEFVVCVAALAPVEVVQAGGTRAAPAVRVIAPSNVKGITLELDDLPAPQLETIKQAAKVDLPSVPAFELPATEPGSHSARELRVRGQRMLGRELTVKGYVTWIYDCAEGLASANPELTPAQIAAAIRSDPTLCERPMFAVGSAPGTPRDSSILVVDVPALPKLGIGDPAAVIGTWTMHPAHAESGRGVLVYKALGPSSPGPARTTGRSNASTELEIDLDVEPRPPLRRFVDDTTLDASIAHLNACNKALSTRQYSTALAECRAATEVWPDNHLAWYARASAHIARQEWAEARAAVENAVKRRPDRAMYQLYLGISSYELERQRVRDVQARSDRRKPDDVALDPSLLQLDGAREALATAIKLAPELWRAHYYLGRIHRDLDDARRAAQQFTAAIKLHPGYRLAYIALSELYRTWDYADQAVAVATLGTTQLPAAEAADLWFEAGMAYDAKHLDDKAIAAFGRAIAARPGDALSKVQRGQLYLRRRDIASAERDLEDVMRSPDSRAASTKRVAAALLAQIANSREASARDARWDCGRRGDAIACRQRSR